MQILGHGGAKAPTLGDILDAHGGVGPGFDFLRIGLAFSILLAHSVQIASGAVTPDDNPFWLCIYLQVPMFFTLSGFLVAGSATRLSLGPFLVNRALRIYPALITEIVLSIFLIGLAFTTVSWSEFFADSHFYLYLTNLVGLPHYVLPGVFQHNPLHWKVNGSLWTVPYELFCYFIMTILISTGIILNRGKLLLFTACMIVFAVEPRVWYYMVGVAKFQNANDISSYLYANLLNPNFTMTFAYFCCGVTGYHYRDKIPYRRAGLVLALAALFGLSLIGRSIAGAIWFKLAALPIGVYLTLFLGLTRVPLPRFLRSGDYSYGVYLYGFPVQQALEALTKSSSLWLNFALAAPLVFLWSRFSWAFIEKPALSLRRRILAPAPRPEAAPRPIPATVKIAA